MIHEQWIDAPIPVWAANNDEFRSVTDGTELMGAPPVLDLYLRHNVAILFRGVSLERLPTVLAAGVDVEPTDSIIYGDFISKAYEYGGENKVIMAFRHSGPDMRPLVLPAVTQISPSTSASDAAEHRRVYPYELSPTAAGHPRLCRVQPQSAADLNYLGTYGYFIAGNPWDALVGLFVYGDAEALAGARRLVDEFADTSTSPVPASSAHETVTP